MLGLSYLNPYVSLISGTVSYDIYEIGEDWNSLLHQFPFKVHAIIASVWLLIDSTLWAAYMNSWIPYLKIYIGNYSVIKFLITVMLPCPSSVKRCFCLHHLPLESYQNSALPGQLFGVHKIINFEWLKVIGSPLRWHACI